MQGPVARGLSKNMVSPGAMSLLATKYLIQSEACGYQNDLDSVLRVYLPNMLFALIKNG